jgi:hypothetical protein
MVDSRKEQTPRQCEDCQVDLTPDLQCPKCGASHTAAPCATCGRVGLHKDDCTEPPGMDTEGGPKYIGNQDRELSALVDAFETTYRTYQAWTFEFMYPGCFSFSQKDSDLMVFFTPDWSDMDKVDIQVQTNEGEFIENEGGDVDFKTDRSALALFNIVKPYLDKLAGKSSKDLTK